MRCFSLFSGIGGFDLAAQRTGHEIVGACEIDKYARRVYERHFPGVRIWEDATRVNPEEIPDFDILCGGFPCQAFSLAGKRLGFEDTRGTLFYEIARIAKQKRPSYLFLENVKGLLYHDEGRTLRTIINTFYELGYDIEWQVINSKYFIPQNRERIFIIGHLGEKPTPKIFPLGTEEKDNTIKDKTTAEIIQCLVASYYKKPTDGAYVIMEQHAQQNGRRINEYAWTLTTRQDRAVLQGENIRMLTPMEFERLQGFPDGWTEGLSDMQRWKCLGNAVTVPVVQYIFEHLTKDRNCEI